MRIVLLGPPGSGKGTQARILAEAYGVVHVAAGDLFRAHMKNQTEIGKQVAELINAGNLVPDAITITMISERIDEADCKNGFILDGFPRTVEQAQALQEMLAEKNIALDAIVQMEVDNEQIVKRVSGRFSCGECGEGYHDTFKKPARENVCDHCGAEGVFKRRPDDAPESVRTRLEVYEKQTAPIIPFYEAKGLLKTVDGMGSMDEVTQRIKAVVGGSASGSGCSACSM